VSRLLNHYPVYPRQIVLMAVLAAGVCASDLLFAAEPDQDAAARRPLALICAANMDRFLEDLDYVLGSVGEQERLDQLHGVITNLNGLKGVDRGRPIGLLVFSSASGMGDPDVVAFIPISSMDDLQVSLKISNQVSLVKGEEEGRWELRGPDRGIPIRVEDQYAFVAQKPERLDGDLPAVSDLTAGAADRYDLSLAVFREGIPEQAIEQGLAKLHADAERERERRDGETDAQHALRTRVSRSAEEVLQHVLTDFEQLTVGLTVSREERAAVIEARVAAQPRSELSNFVASLAAANSQFAGLDPDTTPLSVSSAWSLSDNGSEIAAELLHQVRQQLGQQMQQDFNASSSAEHPVRRVLDALDATAEAGQVDSLVAFSGDRPGGMVLIGAIHLEQADAVSSALEQILPFVGQSADVARLELNALEIDGVSVHRIVPKKIRQQDERLYGADAALYVGAGQDAIWLALGGADTPEVLSRFISGVGATDRAESSRPPLLSLDLHLSSWIGLAGDGRSTNERKFIEVARTAFNDPDRDGLHLEIVSDESGLQLTMQLDEGYVRLFGLALAQRLRQGD
jgi:hypothetical protein